MKFFMWLFISVQITKSSQILNIQRILEQDQKEQKQISEQSKDKGIEIKEFQDKQFKKNTCNQDFTNIFVKGQGDVIPLDGLQVDDQISDLCPNIIVSCCSGEDMEENFKRVDGGLKYFQENLENLKKINNFFQNLQEKDVENFFSKYQKKFRQCILTFNGQEESKDQRFRELIVDIKNLNKLLENKYKQYIQQVFISQYKLQCAICDIQQQANFLHTKHHQREFYNIIVQAPEQIITYFQIQKYYTELYNLELIGQVVECILANENPKYIETLEYGQQPYKRIMKNLQEDQIEDDEDALSLYASEGIPGGQVDFNYDIFLQQLEYIFYDKPTDVLDKKSITFWVPLENKKGFKSFEMFES